ncbi:MAG: hypothetical protein RLZZ602_1205 [Pseudomonadota bacterium]|jgi:ketosteroid isomerase-like protein
MTHMTSADDQVSMMAQIEDLTRRLSAGEDQLALYQSVSAYGPAVDSLQNQMASELWTEDGVYDVGDPRFDAKGREAIKGLFDADYHQQLVAQGCAHTMTMPHVVVSGDVALGLGYHRLFTQEAGGYQLFRLSVSRWEWRKTQQGWLTTRRVHRLISDNGEGQRLLQQTLEDMRALA